jgi:hypothetical protein
MCRNIPSSACASGSYIIDFYSRQRLETQSIHQAGEQKVVNWLVQNGFAGAAQLYANN